MDGVRRALKPKSDWLPLARAVILLRAGVHTDDCEIAIATLEELAVLLKEKTCAADATIDTDTGHFQFVFHEPGGGVDAHGGPPWAFLEDVRSNPVDPRQQAEAVFAKEGFVKFGDEEETERKFRSIREAVGLVWRQYLLRDFDRAVAAGYAALVARVGSVRSGYELLAPEIWRLLTVVNWQHGIARDPDGVLYYSLQAYPIRSVSSVIGTETRIATELAAKLRADPDMKRADAERWCKSQGTVTARGFQNRIWPKARELAGLSTQGMAGRKRKSSR
jgi:hypothetical protein